MLRRLDHRAGHLLLLALAWASVALPNLGAPGLWDIDEGNNSACAYEMAQAGNLIVPTFNYALRTDKPALLYWLQVAAYGACGVNEFAARLPSALASLAAVLSTYELGRRMFGASAGLLAGLIAATAALSCAAGHFANPDALLGACTLATMLVFWRGYRRGGRAWFAAAGVCSGLAVLAKGPVGVALPSAAGVLFLLWQRQLRRLLDPGLLGGILTFLAVAVPWYVWVGLETKGEWLRGFFLTHNLGRFQAPMENHSGPIFYYLVVHLVGFAPWSVFLGPTAWNAWRECRGDPAARPTAAARFLVCWVAVYFVFFSLAGTKLPNYILPAYPALSILTARFLDRWRRGLVEAPAWFLPGSLLCLAAVGLVVTAGALAAGGLVEVKALRGRYVPGVGPLAALGAVPLLGAAAGWWCLRRGRRGGLVLSAGAAAVLFTAALAAWGPPAVDRLKAPRPLAGALPADQLRREVRVGAYDYFQPSLVFYCRREVARPATARDAADFLDGPLPAYLFLPAAAWGELRPRVGRPARLIARHRDLYQDREVVLVTNE
jgi:4-amino-4-deoxy-L-arabinose transferase-like glycosyltransferase